MGEADLEEGSRASIRHAHPEDLEQLAAVEGRCFEQPWSRTLLHTELQLPSSHTLMASVPSTGVVGYATWREIPGAAELLRLAVVPDLRRRGIARALLEALLERLRESGTEHLHLEVRHDNLAALGFYRREGFRHSGRRPGYYEDGTDALILTLDLPS